MDRYNNVKYLLFDSGDTLNKPKTGNWFIPPHFGNHIDPSGVNLKSFRAAFAILHARVWLNKNHLVKTEEEEFEQFKQFYAMIVRRIVKKAPISQESIDSLAYDTVYNDDKFVFFDDVEPGLKALRQRYTLGILSDTWPSLERVFKNKGLRDYFSCFVMSSVYGMTKANPEFFRIALKELGARAEEVLFVDNSESNLAVSKKVGMIPVKICRYKDKEKEKSRFTVINTLDDLMKLLP